MKKKRLTKLAVVIVLILSVHYLLFEEAYGASSAGPSAKKNSGNQSKQASKPILKKANRIVSDPSTFTPNMPFSEAIDILRNSTVPPLNIVVLWKDLEENADIYRHTPIGMDGVSRVPLRTHLKLLLTSVSAGSIEKLGYVVEDGVITIATQNSLPAKMVTRIYDITDLVGEPANYRFMPGFGMPFGYGGMPFGYGGMPFGYGGMPYGGQGSYGSAMPYRGAGYGTFVGRTPTGTGLNTYVTRNNRGYSRSSDLVDLIRTLNSSGNRSSYRNNNRTRNR